MSQSSHISMQLVPRKTLLDIQREIKYRAVYNPRVHGDKANDSFRQILENF
jgi:hypothetical protein